MKMFIFNSTVPGPNCHDVQQEHNYSRQYTYLHDHINAEGMQLALQYTLQHTPTSGLTSNIVEGNISATKQDILVKIMYKMSRNQASNYLKSCLKYLGFFLNLGSIRDRKQNLSGF
jgi:hypothetical protein